VPTAATMQARSRRRIVLLRQFRVIAGRCPALRRLRSKAGTSRFEILFACDNMFRNNLRMPLDIIKTSRPRAQQQRRRRFRPRCPRQATEAFSAARWSLSPQIPKEHALSQGFL
jgi:hypothetical protein